MQFLRLARRTTAKRKEASKYVTFLQAKRGYTREGYAFVAVQSHSTHEWNESTGRFERTNTRPKYVTIVTIVDHRSNCIVSCSCADFKYRWEVALNLHDAAEIEYSNGELPVIRNPQLEPRFCKHLYRLAQAIGPQINKLVPRTPPPRRRGRRTRRR